MKKSERDFNLKDSPLSLFMVSIIFVCTGYLVYLHPEGFELFFNFVMVAGFIILTILILLWYTPFSIYRQKLNVFNSNKSSVRSIQTYHKDINQNTKNQLEKLFKSEEYKKYLKKKQQNPNTPVVLCQKRTLDEAQNIAKELQETEDQLFQGKNHKV